jgi:hypothetical protein
MDIRNILVLDKLDTSTTPLASAPKRLTKWRACDHWSDVWIGELTVRVASGLP